MTDLRMHCSKVECMEGHGVFEAKVICLVAARQGMNHFLFQDFTSHDASPNDVWRLEGAIQDPVNDACT